MLYFSYIDSTSGREVHRRPSEGVGIDENDLASRFRRTFRSETTLDNFHVFGFVTATGAG